MAGGSEEEMISKLKLQNFQSHKETELRFHPGVNVIQGPTDAGKSSVIRALKWVVANRPTGDRLRRHKTKKTSVILDGVTKVKTASTHKYKLGVQEFKALRASVPPEISEELRLSEINFQEQHDAYFLIADNPGQVARTLNKVAELEIIDLSLKEIKKRESGVRAYKKQLKESLEIEEKNVEKLQWIKEADRDYSKIEDLQSEIDSIDTSSLEAQITLAETLLVKLQKIPFTEEDLILCTETTEHLVLDPILSQTIQRVEDNRITIPDPTKDVQELVNFHLNLQPSGLEKSLHDAVWETKHADQGKEYYNINIDEIDSEELQQLTSQVGTLQEAVTEYLVSEDCRDEAERELYNGKEVYQEKLKELGQCPLCGGGV